jgi:hypothetical protein
MKTLAKLENTKLIRNRIFAVAKNPPVAPLKGRGYARQEITTPRVFEKLKAIAPQHCEVVTSRQAVNGFGKLGFVGHNYISPELLTVVVANLDEFNALERALALVSDFGI